MRCPICREFALWGLDSHKCAPMWLGQECEDLSLLETDWVVCANLNVYHVYADDAQHAAEKVAEDDFWAGGCGQERWCIVVINGDDAIRPTKLIDDEEFEVWPKSEYTVCDVSVRPVPEFKAQIRKGKPHEKN